MDSVQYVTQLNIRSGKAENQGLKVDTVLHQAKALERGGTGLLLQPLVTDIQRVKVCLNIQLYCDLCTHAVAMHLIYNPQYKHV